MERAAGRRGRAEIGNSLKPACLRVFVSSKNRCWEPCLKYRGRVTQTMKFRLDFGEREAIKAHRRSTGGARITKPNALSTSTPCTHRRVSDLFSETTPLSNKLAENPHLLRSTPGRSNNQAPLPDCLRAGSRRALSCPRPAPPGPPTQPTALRSPRGGPGQAPYPRGVPPAPPRPSHRAGASPQPGGGRAAAAECVCVGGGNEAGESAARHPEATPARGLSRGRVRRGPRVRGERSRGASDVGSWAGGGGSPPFPCPQRVRGRPPRPLVAWRTRAPRTIRKTEKSAERWFSSDSRFTNHRCPFTVAAGSNARTDFAGSCCCVFRRGKVYAYRKGVVLQKSNTQPSVKRARTP